MEKLALTCKILYDEELLETKRELRKYKARFDVPKINVSDTWFDRSRTAQEMLDSTIEEETIINRVKKALQYAYQEDYKKYSLFFEEQLKQLAESLKILKAYAWYGEDDEPVCEYDYCWHFLNQLFEKVNWMYCFGCNDFVRTCRGLCDKCDQYVEEYPDPGDYVDNTDMLADAIDH